MTIEMQYPMYVVHVSHFLRMTRAMPHQALIASGTSWQYPADHDAVALFVSHQWCGSKHPDPEFAQLRVLQGVFETAAAGLTKVEVDFVTTNGECTMPDCELREVMSWCMWYDYFSVPQPAAEAEPGRFQPELASAIASLPAYVERCRHFIVLVPAVRHESGCLLDYHTWRSRAWCRFERLARVMRGDGSVLIVHRTDAITEMCAQMYLFEPVGVGELSCEEDRPRLAESVRILFEQKAGFFLDHGMMQEYRHLIALQVALLEGLPPSISVSPPLPKIRRNPSTTSSEFCRLDDGGFCERLGLPSPTDVVDGTTPLLLASRSGSLQAMRALIHMRAQLDCKEKLHCRALAVTKHQTPIHIAAAHGHYGAVRLLLSARADARAGMAGSNRTPLHCAGSSGRPEVLRVLLEHRADVEEQCVAGLTPIHNCITFGRLQGVLQLLAAGAGVGVSRDVLSPLHSAAIFGAGPEIVRTLAKARASMEAGYWPRRFSPIWIIVNIACISYRFGVRYRLRRIAYHTWGATPLMVAIMMGCHAEGQAMLELKADPDAKNYRGATAYDLARSFGTLQEHLAAT